MCVAIVIMLLSSYVSRSRSFHIFMTIVALLAVAAVVNVFYHALLQIGDSSSYNLVYVLRVLYHSLLYDVLFLFALYATVVYGFLGIIAVAVIVRLGQLPLHESSLTTMSYIFPVVAMLYLMHSNPYNVSLGAVDKRALEDMVSTLYERKEPFVFMSLFLPDYNVEGREFPEEIKALMRLQLDEAGLVMPDLFIPMAENHGLIHVLTEIREFLPKVAK